MSTHDRRAAVPNGVAAAQEPVRGAGHSALSLIERKTALRILVIGSLATLVLWISEWSSGVIASHDRVAQPALALFMGWQAWRLYRRDTVLISAQRWAVGGLGVYFLVTTVCAVAFDAEGVTPHWLATNFLWLTVVSLLLHLTFPWRLAATMSALLMVITALPAAWQWWEGAPGFDTASTASLLINGALVLVTFIVSLAVVERFRHGIALIIAGEHDAPTDARQALATWLSSHTDELARARDAAESASRAKTRFLAVMSHELRTPLHAMLMSADLLSDKGAASADPGTEARLLRTIQSSGQHLLSLIDQVLEMSRIEAGRVEVAQHLLDLRQVLQKAAAAVKPMAELKGLQLRVAIPEDLPPLRLGDELRLTQVLINLMANACKFTVQGHVTVTVKPAVDAPEHEGWLQITVSDTGLGMDEHEQRRVFEPFYQSDSQTTRRHGGAGLGLTITRELVQLMGGHIGLRSQRGHGTQVDVGLPLPILRDMVPPTQAPTGGSTAALVGRLILVVDDDDVNRMLISEMLTGAGALVHTAHDGAAALQYLRENRPSVVLMDWRMPDMDGLTATLKLREGEVGDLSQDVPVIGLTANAFSEDRHACLSAGMNQVLTKPVDRRQLLDEVIYWAESGSPASVLSPRRSGAR